VRHTALSAGIPVAAGVTGSARAPHISGTSENEQLIKTLRLSAGTQ